MNSGKRYAKKERKIDGYNNNYRKRGGDLHDDRFFSASLEGQAHETRCRSITANVCPALFWNSLLVYIRHIDKKHASHYSECNDVCIMYVYIGYGDQV